MNDFDVRKFYFYNGPNYYLNKPCVVFNLYLDPEEHQVEYYKDKVLEKLPALKEDYPGSVADLFAIVLIEVLKMDIDLFLNDYSISRDEEEFVLAIECLFAEPTDKDVVEEAVFFVSAWFKSLNDKTEFDFEGRFKFLQEEFDYTLFGGPTLYSLIEAGLKRDISVNYIYEENTFQWGYGKKQIRGRSTTFHVDSIKDTEFTMYKDMCGEFLEMCGFPTPKGKNTFSLEDAIIEAEELVYPVVVKPVAGHKGQGVTTGVKNKDEVVQAYENILQLCDEEGIQFEGALVQQQIYGTDHRLLAVGGKFAAALERVPAYVEGDGVNDIKKLIEIDNSTEARLDNARSPLCKIKINEDLVDFLAKQNIGLEHVPEKGEKITLRRVANISQGGVSINVSDKIHPVNIKLVEDIAKYLCITCLGIDVLAQDIAKPWTEGNFGIIEINAGPGVFMHLAPAIGGSIDVPGMIIRHHFPKPGADRIPIIAGNRLSLTFCSLLYDRLSKINPSLEFGSLTKEGISFNGSFFHKHRDHDKNVQIILRNPKLDFAVINHTKDDILDYGTYHSGADIVIIDNPDFAEDVLKDELLPGGLLIEITGNVIDTIMNGESIGKIIIDDQSEKDEFLMKTLENILEDLLKKY